VGIKVYGKVLRGYCALYRVQFSFYEGIHTSK
jgi:hypothetical protein